MATEDTIFFFFFSFLTDDHEKKEEETKKSWRKLLFNHWSDEARERSRREGGGEDLRILFLSLFVLCVCPAVAKAHHSFFFSLSRSIKWYLFFTSLSPIVLWSWKWISVCQEGHFSTFFRFRPFLSLSLDLFRLSLFHVSLWDRRKKTFLILSFHPFFVAFSSLTTTNSFSAQDSNETDGFFFFFFFFSQWGLFFLLWQLIETLSLAETSWRRRRKNDQFVDDVLDYRGRPGDPKTTKKVWKKKQRESVDEVN